LSRVVGQCTSVKEEVSFPQHFSNERGS
jgi:hypothetical protein